MIVQGIDLDGLAAHAVTRSFPPVVKGRTAHIDADFLAYQVSAEKADGTDQKSFDDMKHNAGVAVETLRLMSAAEQVHLHLTPGTSDKGDRYNIALLKQYQGNRIDKPKPRYLNLMREHLAKAWPGTLHQFCEADDGMASAQYKAIAEGDEYRCIIASKDKDLRMVPGWHTDWDTGELVHTGAFGKTWLDESGSTKKLRGYGQSFFWHQMLTGDTADNISGLPAVVGSVMNHVQPTAPVTKALAALADKSSSEVIRKRASALLEARGCSKVGPVLAMKLLENASTNLECLRVVKALYRLYGEKYGFRHWETNADVSWQQAFISEAKLLWMRRDKSDADDVLRWMQEVCE